MKVASYGADLSAGGASGDADEKRLSNNVGILVTVPKMCFTVPGHTCNVWSALLYWWIIAAELLPQHYRYCFTLPFFISVSLIKYLLNIFVNIYSNIHTAYNHFNYYLLNAIFLCI